MSALTPEVESALTRLVVANDTCGNGKCASCGGYGGPDDPLGDGCEGGHAADFATIRTELDSLTAEVERVTGERNWLAAVAVTSDLAMSNGWTRAELLAAAKEADHEGAIPAFDRILAELANRRELCEQYEADAKAIQPELTLLRAEHEAATLWRNAPAGVARSSAQEYTGWLAAHDAAERAK